MKMGTGNAKLYTSYLMQGLQADVSCVTEAMQCGVQSTADTGSGQIKIKSWLPHIQQQPYTTCLNFTMYFPPALFYQQNLIILDSGCIALW